MPGANKTLALLVVVTKNEQPLGSGEGHLCLASLLVSKGQGRLFLDKAM